MERDHTSSTGVFSTIMNDQASTGASDVVHCGLIGPLPPTWAVVHRA